MVSGQGDGTPPVRAMTPNLLVVLLLLHVGDGVSTAFITTPPQCISRNNDMIWQGSSPRVVRIVNPQRMSDGSNENNDEGTSGADLAAQFFKTLSDRNISIEDDEMMDEEDEEEDERYEMEQRDEGEIVSDGGASSTSLSEDDFDDEDDAILREYDVSPNEGVYSTLTNEQIYDEMKDRVLESAGAFVELTRGAEDGGGVNDAVSKVYRPPTNVPDSGLTAGEVVELVLMALRNNNVPSLDYGIEILFGYSSPESLIVEQIETDGLSPSQYRNFLCSSEENMALFEYTTVVIDKADFSPDRLKGYFTARLLNGESYTNESYCTFTLASDVTAGGLPSEEEIAKQIESNDPKVKRHALKAAIMAMLGGEAMPRILMQVIRFCINSDDKPLKKLCMLYWEVVPKYQEPSSDEVLRAAAGGQPVPRKLLPEMILVCNALMNDLNHPNEFVRGSMLRFLCKVKDEEILGPILPSIKACLQHRHPYVRKNAAMAVYHAFRLHGETLLPDGPELIDAFINVETDVGARRNAFLMLYNESEDFAINFLAKNLDDVSKFGDGFALQVLDLTRKACRKDPNQKSRFVRVLFQMLSSESPAVSYEAAWTLISLSNSPTAVRAAAVTYTNLLNSQNDNNVIMIVLERLEQLQKKHSKILQELLPDIMRALSSPNPDICKKVLDVSMTLVTSKNVVDVVTTLKREVSKTTQESSDSSEDKGKVYRNMLITAIHGCAVRFPDVAESVVHTLMDFLSSDGAMQVIIFVRAIVERYPNLRPAILSKLINTIDEVTNNSVMCICLWILGEYCETLNTVENAFDVITKQLGNAPFVVQAEEKQAQEQAAAAAAKGPKMVTKNVILADGTYATQTVYSEPKISASSLDKSPHLRKMIIGGDIFLGTIISSSLTKLCLRSPDMGVDAVAVKAMTVKALLSMCGIVKMAEVAVSAQKSSLADCSERVTLCCRALLDPKAKALLKNTLLSEGKASFASFLVHVQDKAASSGADEPKEVVITTQADDLIHFRQLKSLTAQSGDLDLDDGSDLARATGYADGGSLLSNELSHVYQLSGFADPVYAEAFVTVHDYDILLEILIINRTPNTLANLTVELSTMGDMKIVERPQSQTIGPLDQMTIRASIKVSSTETGHIFGTIVYEDASTQEKGYINLNDIHMDIMDYIRPATCTDEVFRSMWAEFEWENKVAIATSINGLIEFVDHIVTSTNMSCLTPHDRSEKGSFLAANLYAKSVFGEDALVNVSVEKKVDNDGKLAGYIRIRSKTQGIALSLGDRITSVQRGLLPKQ